MTGVRRAKRKSLGALAQHYFQNCGWWRLRQTPWLCTRLIDSFCQPGARTRRRVRTSTATTTAGANRSDSLRRRRRLRLPCFIFRRQRLKELIKSSLSDAKRRYRLRSLLLEVRVRLRVVFLVDRCDAAFASRAAPGNRSAAFGSASARRALQFGRRTHARARQSALCPFAHRRRAGAHHASATPAPQSRAGRVEPPPFVETFDVDDELEFVD